MNIRFNILFKLACGSMFVGVGLGAKYGHVGQLDEDSAALFHKAQLYNVTNSVGLIASSLIASPSIPLKVAAGGFILGQLLFIAPLFYQSIKGRDPLFRFMVPIGGVAIMTAWLSLIFA